MEEKNFKRDFSDLYPYRDLPVAELYNKKKDLAVKHFGVRGPGALPRKTVMEYMIKSE